jgi:hypothetical protein
MRPVKQWEVVRRCPTMVTGGAAAVDRRRLVGRNISGGVSL